MRLTFIHPLVAFGNYKIAESVDYEHELFE